VVVRDDKEGVNRIALRHGEPIRFGPGGERGLRQRSDGSIEVCAGDDEHILLHDESHETAALAFALTRVTQQTHGATPVGVFRNIQRPVYDELMADQIAVAQEKRGRGDLAELLHSGETWTIG